MARRLTTENTLKLRLNELFDRSRPRLTNRQVVKAMAAQGCQISAPYLSQLRTGTRTCPSDEVLTALASYFGVSAEYFFSAPGMRRYGNNRRDDSHLVASIRQPGLNRLLMAAHGLSGTSLDLLAELATRLRASDERRVVPADSPSYIRLVATASPCPRDTEAERTLFPTRSAAPAERSSKPGEG